MEDVKKIYAAIPGGQGMENIRSQCCVVSLARLRQSDAVSFNFSRWERSWVLRLPLCQPAISFPCLKLLRSWPCRRRGQDTKPAPAPEFKFGSTYIKIKPELFNQGLMDVNVPNCKHLLIWCTAF